MSEEYGPDFVSVTDDDGNEFELEHLGTLEYNGQEYMAFVPADMDEDDETGPGRGGVDHDHVSTPRLFATRSQRLKRNQLPLLGSNYVTLPC